MQRYLSFPGGSVVKNLPANAGDTREVGSIPDQEDPLEWKMATHSSILACRVPWTEESGGLQDMGFQRVGHDWVSWARMHKLFCTRSWNTWKSAIYNLGDWSNYLSLSIFLPLWNEHNSHSVLVPALGRCNSHPVHYEVYITAQKPARHWESAKQSPLHILQRVCSCHWSTGLWSCAEPLHRAALSDKASSATGL